MLLARKLNCSIVLKNSKHTSNRKHLLFQCSYHHQPHRAYFHARHAHSLQYSSYRILIITTQFKGSSILSHTDQ